MASGGYAWRDLLPRLQLPAPATLRRVGPSCPGPTRTRLSSPTAGWLAPSRRSISDFRVQKMLGEGNMSSVVHCVCSRSGAHVAVKMYHRDRMNSMNVKQVKPGLRQGGRGAHCLAGLMHVMLLSKCLGRVCLQAEQGRR